MLATLTFSLFSLNYFCIYRCAQLTIFLLFHTFINLPTKATSTNKEESFRLYWKKKLNNMTNHQENPALSRFDGRRVSPIHVFQPIIAA